MSFVHSHADPAARAKAVFVVTGVHALLGAGLVLGLTFTGVFEPNRNLPAHQFPTAPPPDNTLPPPEPSEAKNAYVHVPVPVPPVDIYAAEANDVPPEVDSPPATPTGYVPGPLPTPTFAPTPVPTATYSPQLASPRNQPSGWITNDDYSAADIRRGNEGSAAYRLVIGSDGQVDACEITASTGFATLDRATCRLIQRRARFEPAKDQLGRAVVGIYTGQVTWQIPE